MRQPAARVKPRIAKLQSFPAPVGGWIANINLSTPGARRADGTKVSGAARLENWFPTATGIRTRAGSQRYATIGTESDPATSMFSYVNGNTAKLFAANASAIYDVTTISVAEDRFAVDELGRFLVNSDGEFIVISASPEASVDELSGGDWSVVQFATSGGVFLRAVNGIDTPLVFDGADWATTPAITGATSTTLSHVWAFKNRLFFVQKDTLDAWYLPVDSIGGAAVKFPLGGVFTRGGSLMFGAAWSLDTGAGLNEQCVFVTTEGEVAVYQGSDPSSADSWEKVGVYRIGRPRGQQAYIQAGGDLVIATDIGFVPLSQAIQRDIAALSPGAISYPIEDAWNDMVSERTTASWKCKVWPTKQMVLISFPMTGGQEEVVFVANARTGAWSKYTNWGVTCMEVFNGRLFYGTADGLILEGEVSGLDDGNVFTAVCVPLFEPLKTPASLKTGLMARGVLRARADVNAQLSLQKDYLVSLPPSPEAVATSGSSAWGAAKWGQFKWGGGDEKRTYQSWQSAPGCGYALSVGIQVTSGALSPLEADLVQLDLTYETGDIGT